MQGAQRSAGCLSADRPSGSVARSSPARRATPENEFLPGSSEAISLFAHLANRIKSLRTVQDLFRLSPAGDAGRLADVRDRSAGGLRGSGRRDVRTTHGRDRVRRWHAGGGRPQSHAPSDSAIQRPAGQAKASQRVHRNNYASVVGLHPDLGIIWPAIASPFHELTPERDESAWTGPAVTGVPRLVDTANS